jgi:hypothetical protein
VPAKVVERFRLIRYLSGMIVQHQTPPNATRTVTATVSPDTEENLRALAAQSGQTGESFLGALAEAAVEQARNLACQSPQPFRDRSPEERLAALHAWVNSHSHITAVADDSRESIYAGRGE